MRSDGESGWILLEAVLLGLIALATAAVLGIFARTALLEEHAAARMEAALLARAQFSVMEAELDQGTEPLSAATQINSNDRSYQIERTITRAGEFYDVSLRISWQILGQEEQVDFVRRLRQHVRVETTP
ncbi:hypothetical protein HMPREF9081_0803 [Centipeda periodontii DSM 2778]|uniref:Type II secretion system protein n=1 Tax=Centipeda periodontii DSM 2778 TaxID=888060 RepID=F5RKL8_9FIRM|nr:hypothetical protein [Centipeda periodontii]EGK60946.1 hypothetical protein HMPREF9081_0803 [Centipeda periodontii DSM 2778]